MITEQNIQDIQYLLDIAWDGGIMTPQDEEVVERTQRLLDELRRKLKTNPL